MKNSLCLVLALLTFMVGAPLLVAQNTLTAEQERRIQELERLSQEQEQRLEVLQQKLDTVQNQEKAQYERIAEKSLAQPEAAEDAFSAGYDKDGFFIKKGDDIRWNLTGYTRGQVSVFENNTPLNNTVAVPFAYLAHDIWFYKHFHARIQFELRNGGNTLHDAFVEAGVDEAHLRVGQMHVPFTIERQDNEVDIIGLSYEPQTQSWSHGRDPGVMLWGIFNDMIEYKLSMHNGDGRNNNNTDDNFLFAAQARFFFFKQSENPDSYFHLAVIRNRTEANQDNNINSGNLFNNWGRKIFDGETGGGSGEEGDITQGYRTGVDVGVSLDHSGLRVRSEFMWNDWERDLTNADGTNTRRTHLMGWGAYFAISYRIPIDDEKDGASIIPLFKYSYADVDDREATRINSGPGADDVRGQSIHAITLGVVHEFNKHVNVGFDWVVTTLDEKRIQPAKDQRTGDPDGADTGGLEHAWFFAMSAKF